MVQQPGNSQSTAFLLREIIALLKLLRKDLKK